MNPHRAEMSDTIRTALPYQNCRFYNEDWKRTYVSSSDFPENSSTDYQESIVSGKGTGNSPRFSENENAVVQNMCNKKNEKLRKPCENGFCFCFASDSDEICRKAQDSRRKPKGSKGLRNDVRRYPLCTSDRCRKNCQVITVPEVGRHREKESARSSEKDGERERKISKLSKEIKVDIITKDGKQMHECKRGKVFKDLEESCDSDAPMVHIVQEIRKNIVISEIRVNTKKINARRSSDSEDQKSIHDTKVASSSRGKSKKHSVHHANNNIADDNAINEYRNDLDGGALDQEMSYDSLSEKPKYGKRKGGKLLLKRIGSDAAEKVIAKHRNNKEPPKKPPRNFSSSSEKSFHMDSRRSNKNKADKLDESDVKERTINANMDSFPEKSFSNSDIKPSSDTTSRPQTARIYPTFDDFTSNEILENIKQRDPFAYKSVVPSCPPLNEITMTANEMEDPNRIEILRSSFDSPNKPEQFSSTSYAPRKYEESMIVTKSNNNYPSSPVPGNVYSIYTVDGHANPTSVYVVKNPETLECTPIMVEKFLAHERAVSMQPWRGPIRIDIGNQNIEEAEKPLSDEFRTFSGPENDSGPSNQLRSMSNNVARGRFSLSPERFDGNEDFLLGILKPHNFGAINKDDISPEILHMLSYSIPPSANAFQTQQSIAEPQQKLETENVQTASSITCTQPTTATTEFSKTSAPNDVHIEVGRSVFYMLPASTPEQNVSSPSPPFSPNGSRVPNNYGDDDGKNGSGGSGGNWVLPHSAPLSPKIEQNINANLPYFIPTTEYKPKELDKTSSGNIVTGATPFSESRLPVQSTQSHTTSPGTRSMPLYSATIPVVTPGSMSMPPYPPHNPQIASGKNETPPYPAQGFIVAPRGIVMYPNLPQSPAVAPASLSSAISSPQPGAAFPESSNPSATTTTSPGCISLPHSTLRTAAVPGSSSTPHYAGETAPAAAINLIPEKLSDQNPIKVPQIVTSVTSTTDTISHTPTIASRSVNTPHAETHKSGNTEVNKSSKSRPPHSPPIPPVSHSSQSNPVKDVHESHRSQVHPVKNPAPVTVKHITEIHEVHTLHSPQDPQSSQGHQENRHTSASPPQNHSILSPKTGSRYASMHIPKSDPSEGVLRSPKLGMPTILEGTSDRNNPGQNRRSQFSPASHPSSMTYPAESKHVADHPNSSIQVGPASNTHGPSTIAARNMNIENLQPQNPATVPESTRPHEPARDLQPPFLPTTSGTSYSPPPPGFNISSQRESNIPPIEGRYLAEFITPRNFGEYIFPKDSNTFHQIEPTVNPPPVGWMQPHKLDIDTVDARTDSESADEFRRFAENMPFKSTPKKSEEFENPNETTIPSSLGPPKPARLEQLPDRPERRSKRIEKSADESNSKRQLEFPAPPLQTPPVDIGAVNDFLRLLRLEEDRNRTEAMSRIQPDHAEGVDRNDDLNMESKREKESKTKSINTSFRKKTLNGTKKLWKNSKNKLLNLSKKKEEKSLTDGETKKSSTGLPLTNPDGIRLGSPHGKRLSLSSDNLAKNQSNKFQNRRSEAFDLPPMTLNNEKFPPPKPPRYSLEPFDFNRVVESPKEDRVATKKFLTFSPRKFLKTFSPSQSHVSNENPDSYKSYASGYNEDFALAMGGFLGTIRSKLETSDDTSDLCSIKNGTRINNEISARADVHSEPIYAEIPETINNYVPKIDNMLVEKQIFPSQSLNHLPVLVLNKTDPNVLYAKVCKKSNVHNGKSQSLNNLSQENSPSQAENRYKATLSSDSDICLNNLFTTNDNAAIEKPTSSSSQKSCHRKCASPSPTPPSSSSQTSSSSAAASNRLPLPPLPPLPPPPSPHRNLNSCPINGNNSGRPLPFHCRSGENVSVETKSRDNNDMSFLVNLALNVQLKFQGCPINDKDSKVYIQHTLDAHCTKETNPKSNQKPTPGDSEREHPKRTPSSVPSHSSSHTESTHFESFKDMPFEMNDLRSAMPSVASSQKLSSHFPSDTTSFNTAQEYSSSTSKSPNSSSNEKYKGLTNRLRKSFRKSKSYLKNETKRLSGVFDKTFNKGEHSRDGAAALEVNEHYSMELLNEISAQNSIKNQIMQAVNICRDMPEFENSTELVEAERLLLVSTLKEGAITEELVKIDYMQEGLVPNMNGRNGTVIIDEFELPVRVDPNYDTFFNYFYIGVFSSGPQMKSTYSEEKRNSFVFFRDCNIVFENLESDFEIKVDIYALRLRKISNVPTKKDKSLTRSKRNSCSSVDSKDDVVSRFRLHAYFTLRAQNLTPYIVKDKTDSFQSLDSFKLTANSTCRLPLNLISKNTNLMEDVRLNARAEINFNNFDIRGFLNVEDTGNNGNNWNRRWCQIEAFTLFLWNYPQDCNEKPPILAVDLTKCNVYPIASVDRSVCPKPRTFSIHLCENDYDGVGPASKLYLFSSDNQSDFNCWISRLNDVLDFIRTWKI